MTHDKQLAVKKDERFMESWEGCGSGFTVSDRHQETILGIEKKSTSQAGNSLN